MTDRAARRELPGDRPAAAPESELSRRAVLRGGLAAGAAAGTLLGLAACGAGPAPRPAAAPGPVGSPAPGTTPAPSSAGPSSAVPDDSRADSAGPAAGPATELVHARTGRPEVALTFHGAGDDTLDRTVLETLSKAGASVTVLAVGTWLAHYPDAARMVLDLGHELGNHTWSHRTMSRLSVAGQREEIVRCRDRIAQATGGPGAFFRQSAAQHATPTLLGLAGQAGYRSVLSYDLDSLDWTDPGPATVTAQLRKAVSGSVVSMHLGHAGTLAALPKILAELSDRGLRPVTATRLFAA